MKKLFFSIFILSALFACKMEPEEPMVAGTAYDSLLKETTQRDSAMTELVKTINLIDENMAKISDRKNEISLRANDPEFQPDQRQVILDDIQTIYEMMQQNKNRIAELNNRLADTKRKVNKSANELKHANELIEQYQVMIDKMMKKIELKDAEIEGLKGQLARMDISLDSLKAEFATQHEEMNKVYYAYGTKRELLDNNVIDTKGGFIGIGKSRQLKSDFNKSYFTEADAETLNEIPLNVKKAAVLSTHREGSYQLIGEDPIEKLVIKDQEAFWEASKFLVIEVSQ